jgi:uncharacterized membrane protein YfcA
MMAEAWWLAYLVLGLLVGFFAGLLGIGGGIIIVTMLVFMFGVQGFPADRIVHLALGTSMASIVFTSLSSVRAHHAYAAVRWDILRRAVPGVVIGTVLGTVLADALPSHYLAIFFTGFVYYSAAQMWLDLEPKPARALPGVAGMLAASVAIGAISSLVGAGGGVISIPLMILCNVSMRHAIGTSAALGLPIAIAGTAGYILTGLGQDHLPPLSLGYVYIPALIGLVIGTFVTVPYGARAAHRLPVPILKKIFGVIFFILATRMLLSLFQGL